MVYRLIINAYHLFIPFRISLLNSVSVTSIHDTYILFKSANKQPNPSVSCGMSSRLGRQTCNDWQPHLQQATQY